VELIGERVSDQEKQSPVTSETFDFREMRETASINYYDAIGSLKEADVMPGSIGFKIINTRGFNSTTPIRSLQLIDGVDNQSPGLNFSLGNFLGPSELDVLKVDLISGAAGAYYGPSAFNGVISIETKDPFIHKGLSSMVRFGERNLLEGSVRYANSFLNKKGDELFAFKLNLFGFKANDWVADNYEPITDSRVLATNPGRYDAVNIYGDEYYSPNDYTLPNDGHLARYPGIQSFYRIGYREEDLIDYNTHNYKAGLSLHLRSNPAKGFESPVVILSSAIGGGTTVYQGDNRFMLKDIFFQQHKIEFTQKDKFFLRGYLTLEDAGQSYDPYFTALRLQEMSKSEAEWHTDYDKYWFVDANIPARMEALGYPRLVYPGPTFDFDAARAWEVAYADSLRHWHTLAAEYVNSGQEGVPFFEPGTARFDSAFNLVTSRLNNQEGGTRFFDKSSLFHVQGEYSIETKFLSELKLGGSFRKYMPHSRGTIFSDTAGLRITNSEIGLYAGVRKKWFDQRLLISATVRVDKNENLRWIQTLASSAIYQIGAGTYLRASYSGAIRNPTLIDQYMFLNVGPAILAGHLDRVDSLITLESFYDYLNHNDRDLLRYFSIDPIRPERVNTYELGIRSTIDKRLFVDMTYYRNHYRDFLGYLIGLTAIIPESSIPSPRSVQVYRYSANTHNRVVTQGFSVGLSYYPTQRLTFSGNYSYNSLTKTVAEDPIIPAYNTPTHKFNLGVTGRDIHLADLSILNSVGFTLHYKWVKEYWYEGSPQFTGHVPAYGIVDAQVNTTIKKNTIIKIGASNILNKKHFAVYGGPRSGRMAYVSVSYQF
jgi:outer membrane receptor protein involved in Fe transport